MVKIIFWSFMHITDYEGGILSHFTERLALPFTGFIHFQTDGIWAQTNYCSFEAKDCNDVGSIIWYNIPRKPFFLSCKKDGYNKLLAFTIINMVLLLRRFPGSWQHHLVYSLENYVFFSKLFTWEKQVISYQ